MKRVLACLASLVLTAVLLAGLPYGHEKEGTQAQNTYILRVWVPQGQVDLQAWLKQAAAMYEKESGRRVYIRTATAEEMENKEGAVLPDVMAGTAAGIPVAYRGYALVMPDAEGEKATPSPPPGLFVRPTLAPSTEPKESAPFPDEPETVALPPEMQHVYPRGYVASNPLQELVQGKAAAALLSPRQMEETAMGYRMDSGKVYFLAFHTRGLSEEGEAFLSFLRSESAQQLLAGQLLFSWNPGLCLYGAERITLYRMEQCRKNFPE